MSRWWTSTGSGWKRRSSSVPHTRSTRQRTSRCRPFVTSTAALALILSSGAAGSQKTAAQMVRMARPGGTLVQVGNIAGETPFPLLAFTRKELRLLSVYRYANTFPAAIAAAASRQIDISQIISRIYDFEETGRAYEDGVRDKQSLVKAIIIVSS